MDQIAVNSPVSVLERMNVVIECQRRRSYHGIEPAGWARSNAVRPSINEPRSSGRALMWSGSASDAVVFADKSPFLPKAQANKAGVADDDLLQAQQFLQIDRAATRLSDCTAPALNPVLRSVLALYRVTRLGIL
jgi:hypothetical protein